MRVLRYVGCKGLQFGSLRGCAYDVGHGIVGVESSGKVYASAVYVLAREPGQLMLMMLVRFEFRVKAGAGDAHDASAAHLVHFLEN